MFNQIFQEACRTGGSRAALVFGNERWNYAQLEEQVARCAAGLKKSGAEPDRGVALILKNSPEFIFSYLAASRLGVTAFLVDSGSKASELRRVLTENQIAVVISEPEQLSSIEQIREETGQHLSIYDRGGNFADLMGAATEPPASQVYENEIAIVQYTSGTTGVPKCTARSHRNLAWEMKDFNLTTGIAADDRVLCTIPLYHAHGLVNAFLAAIYAGATLVLLEEFNRAAVVELFARERVTVFPAVPLLFDLLGRRVMGQSRPGNSLRLVFSAGAPLSSAVAREFREAFGVYVRQLYGTTEVGSAAINLDLNLQATLDSVGLPMKNVRIEILQEDGSAVAQGEVGEVAIQSPAMPDGYLRQAEATQQRFHHGFFWPGDVGRKDDRGYLYIQGRAAWLVSSAGRKVDPMEVEAVIAAFPKVREVVVVGVPGYLGEQTVKAVVVASEPCQEQEIVAFCQERLADFKIPRLVEFVDEIPRNAYGKILRKNLIS
ncbi:MAG: class I adenylate-forming enzyme family protein [Candidatus Korobacteraceae bacterium]